MATIQKEYLPSGENIKVLLVENECINETEFSSFNRQSIQLNSPFAFGKSIEVKKQKGILFSIEEGYLSLKRHEDSMISKDKFFATIRSLLEIIKTVKNPENIMLDFDYMYLDRGQQSFKLIYLPIINNMMKYDPFEFFQNYLHVFQFSADEDDFSQKYFQYFKETELFSLKNFEQFIAELSGEKVKEIEFAEQTQQTPMNTALAYNVLEAVEDSPVKVEKESIPLSQSKDDFKIVEKQSIVHTGICFCPNCGSEMSSEFKFCSKCGTKLAHQVVNHPLSNSISFNVTSKTPIEMQAVLNSGSILQQDTITQAPDIEGTTVLGLQEESGIEGTTVLGAAEEVVVKAYLKRHKNDDKILLHEDGFLLGKDPATSHYVIDGNSAISRKHAKIMLQNHRYFLIDCNSTNKSYIDGLQVQPEVPTEIFNGAIIRLANEDFYFILE